ncbi:antitoxin [Microlunatus sp. Y2014]|uniref:antitoxin n=1 Tax=Microlunatus sp. Y2014 TaxID=3418488 RepID=UPI003DA70193
MSRQIAVRLPDAMVEYLDQAVARGQAPSRAAVVTSALEREMRARMAQRDVEVLQVTGAEDDLDDLVSWTVAHPTPVED